MRYLCCGAAGLLVIFIVLGTLISLRHSGQKETGKVFLSKFLFILGAVCSVLLLIPTLITAFAGEALWVTAIFLFLQMLSMSLVIAFVNCRITYDENGFYSRNFLGIRRYYTYGQVKAIKENVHESFIHVGRRKVLIDEYAIGGKAFISAVKKYYRATHNGRKIPAVKRKCDPFNGHIQSPGEIVFAYIMVAVFALAFVAFTVYVVFFDFYTTSNTLEQTVVFRSGEVIDERFIMISEDDQIYKISFVDGDFNSDKIKALCDGKTTVTVYCEEMTPDDEHYFSVKAIVYRDVYILSFDETHELQKQEYWPLILMSSGMFLGWIVYIIASVRIGRNPQKFSKALVRSFFKDNVVKY